MRRATPAGTRLAGALLFVGGTRPETANCFATTASYLGPAQFAGIKPPSAAVNSAATSRTIRPRSGKRSSLTRLVMPETEIAAKGSLQSL